LTDVRKPAPESGLTPAQQNAAEVIRWRVVQDLQPADRIEDAARTWLRATGQRASRELVQKMADWVRREA
jgi:hypothetical protein